MKNITEKYTFKYNIFDARWWANFKEETNNFGGIRLVEEVLQEDEVSGVQKSLYRILHKIDKLQAYTDGFRLWIGEQRKDFNYIRNLLNGSYAENSNIETWARQVFSDNRFCLILNYAERFDNYFASFFSSALDPFIKEYGLPANGLHTTTFIGNYGYTPIGIHLDTANSFVFSFHLGPENKLMYIWDKQTYEGMNPRVNETDVERFLSVAKKYEMKPGSLYFMPWGIYHLGKTTELSVSVTVWFDNHPHKKVIKSLMDDYLENALATHPVNLQDQVTLGNYNQKFMEVMPKIGVQENVSISKTLQSVYEERVKMLFSNGGWSKKPISLSNEGISAKIELQVNTEIKLVTPFQITMIEAEEKLKLFARGFEIILPNVAGVFGFIHQLNSYNTLRFEEVCSIMINDLPIESIKYIVSLFYNAKAIELSQ